MTGQAVNGHQQDVHSEARQSLITKVIEERKRQSHLHPTHLDDAHSAPDWVAIFTHHLGLVAHNKHADEERFEEQMVRLAAVALAALESSSRLKEAKKLERQGVRRKWWQGIADQAGEPYLVLTKDFSHVSGVQDTLAYGIKESEASEWHKSNYVLRLVPSTVCE